MRGRHIAGRTCGLLVTAGLLVAPAASARAQVLELSGGASTLYQAEGASLLLRAPNSTASVGAGYAGGRFVGGGSVQRRQGPFLLSGGMQELELDLPTDLEPGHRFRAVGLGLQRGGVPADSAGRDRWQVFAGSTSSWMSTPLFQGVRPDAPAFAALFRRELPGGMELSSQTVYASRFTALESLAWQGGRALRLAGTAGVSGGSPYAALSAEMHRPMIEAKGSFVATRETFQRAGLDADLSAEPIRGNVDVVLRSSDNPRYTMEAGHHTFLNPLAASADTHTAAHPVTVERSPSLVSVVDDLSVNTHLSHVGLGVSGIDSRYQGQQTTGGAITGSLDLPYGWTAEARYLQSALHGAEADSSEHTAVVTAGRAVNSRLQLNGVFTRSSGRNSVSAEGSLTTNLLKLSATVQTLYVPTDPARPFQQYLVFSSELNLFGRLRLLAGSFVSPGGRMLYTAEAHALSTHGLPLTRTVSQPNFGQYLLRGRVVDIHDAPVTGAAVDVDGAVLFTDSEGTFFLRERQRRTHRLRLLPDQFLDGFSYRVVSQPAVLESCREAPAGPNRTTTAAENGVPRFIVERRADTGTATGKAELASRGSR